jgi:hypothetical protein
MKKAVTKKPEPEQGMTKWEALALASGLASHIEDVGEGYIPDFILLLKWLAYKADATEREEAYIWTKDEYLRCFDGVGEAADDGLRKALDTLRRRRKGGEGR